MKEIKVIFNRDIDTPVSIEGDIIRADWYDAGEGLFGDYNPDNPCDAPLLRFDIYKKVEDEWEEVEDASYCTQINVGTSESTLIRLLYSIYTEYDNVLRYDPYASVKKLGETLSWIS